MIKITLELSDLVVMQQKHIMSLIFHKRNLPTGLPVANTLINHNNNSLKENEEEEEMEPIGIEFTE